MTIFRLRSLISHIANPHAPNPAGARPKNWPARNWALVTLAGILAIAGLEGYALSLGIDGTALRAALTSIGVLGGAGFGRVLK
ncbi:MAG: hypothetical protein J4N86_09595 [Chloroflexi bacterium]|nr:hypothetical protein [Chloroflexota bacterium]MCH8893157.1 hypothetical protein [Chloroflexota bacterium]MCI0848777.1 hypothetical protein [Chloroflexota bacterium]